MKLPLNEELNRFSIYQNLKLQKKTCVLYIIGYQRTKKIYVKTLTKLIKIKYLRNICHGARFKSNKTKKYSLGRYWIQIIYSNMIIWIKYFMIHCFNNNLFLKKKKSIIFVIYRRYYIINFMLIYQFKNKLCNIFTEECIVHS